ncbi:MAG: ABC transporter substrate-binding protein [Anaerolineae bacterium]
MCIAGCHPYAVPRVVKIGLVAPFEGHDRYIGYDAVYAARLAIREINTAGGLDGWRFELVAYDDRGDVELAQSVARNLAIDPDVVLVIGHYRPDTTAVAAPIYAEAGLPLIAIGGWVDTHTEASSGGAWSTVTSPPGVRHLLPGPHYLAEAMLREVPEGTDAVVWGQGPIADYLLQAPSVVTDAAVPPVGVGAAFGLLSPIEAAETLLAWREAGWRGLLVGEANLAAASFREVAGMEAVGTGFVTPYPFPRDVEGAAPWRERYLGVGPHVSEPGLYALPTYEAVYLAAEAAAGAFSEEPKNARVEVAEALEDARRVGLLGEIRWDGDGYWETPPLYVYRWTEEGPALMHVVTSSAEAAP